MSHAGQYHALSPCRERATLLTLGAVQFTHILDFMIMMPLGPQLMRELSLSASEFSLLIAAYTMTAGVVGLLSAPFIDRFDRRTVLITCYVGFILGTYACAISHSAIRLAAIRSPDNAGRRHESH